MKKILLGIVMASMLLSFSPFVYADVQITQQESIQQQINVIIQLIKVLQAQLDAMIAQEALATSQNIATNQVVQNVLPVVTSSPIVEPTPIVEPVVIAPYLNITTLGTFGQSDFTWKAETYKCGNRLLVVSDRESTKWNYLLHDGVTGDGYIPTLGAGEVKMSFTCETGISQTLTFTLP